MSVATAPVACRLTATTRERLTLLSPFVLAFTADPGNLFLLLRAVAARVSLPLGIPFGLTLSANPGDLLRLHCGRLTLGRHD